jgi:hypothetical protein
LNWYTLQEIAEITQLLPSVCLLTQEVFVADIETTLHETSTLCADSLLSRQSLKIRLLLLSSQT